eukprot:6289045-Lingulodinium_polyedra.AAC.1
MPLMPPGSADGRGRAKPVGASRAAGPTTGGRCHRVLRWPGRGWAVQGFKWGRGPGKFADWPMHRAAARC